MIGKTFLRLERDFDKHVTYCRDEPNAQDFLSERDDVRNYFSVRLLLSFVELFLVEIAAKSKKKTFSKV